jgi:hypothetical protein
MVDGQRDAVSDEVDLRELNYYVLDVRKQVQVVVDLYFEVIYF